MACIGTKRFVVESNGVTSGQPTQYLGKVVRPRHIGSVNEHWDEPYTAI